MNLAIGTLSASELAGLVAANLVAALAIGHRLWRAGKRCRTSRVWQRESGATYAMQVIVLTPFFLLTVAFLAELSLLSVAKVGVTYAAFSAARGAAVWLPTDVPEETRQAMVHTAAVNALWPYASGSAQHHAPNAAPAAASQAAIDAYRAYSGGSLDAEYLKRKYDYAWGATRVETARSSQDFNAELAVTVTYDAPYHVPGIGRLFGQRSSTGQFIQPISSTATIEQEGHKSDDQRLGIDYYRMADFLKPVPHPTAATPETAPGAVSNAAQAPVPSTVTIQGAVFLRYVDVLDGQGKNHKVPLYRFAPGPELHINGLYNATGIYISQPDDGRSPYAAFDWVEEMALAHEMQHAIDDLKDGTRDWKFTDTAEDALSHVLIQEARAMVAEANRGSSMWNIFNEERNRRNLHREQTARQLRVADAILMRAREERSATVRESLFSEALKATEDQASRNYGHKYVIPEIDRIKASLIGQSQPEDR